MDFRSHLSRPMDFRSAPNLIIGILTLATAGIALVLWVNGEPATIVVSPIYAFVVWALAREIDPDHNWAAVVAATLTAVWALVGGNVMSVVAVAGLMLAARLVTSSTGRRPLPGDLLVMAVFGIAIGFTVEGWVAGFAIALAIYLDDRFAEKSRLVAVGASSATAIGTTIVATLTDTFPERLPNIDQVVAIAAGLAALILIVREPAPPISQVDARHASFIERGRLHASRSLVGILTFLIAVLTGVEADGTTVVLAALVVVIASNEVELLRRRDL